MGHTSTEMLFRVYSRFVPNLTRQDGSAFESLLMQHQLLTPGNLNEYDSEKRKEVQKEDNNEQSI